MINLNKYQEGLLEFPSVVDMIDFQDHVVLDIIQYENEIFSKKDEVFYNNQKSIIQKILKNNLLKTEQNINRSEIRKVRYFCKKVFDK